MTITLIKSLDEFTGEEKDAILAGDQDAWAKAVDGWDEQAQALRGRFISASVDAVFSTDDVAIALNYVESTRILMHFTLRIMIGRFQEWRRYFATGLCAYCAWRHVDEVFANSSADEMTEESISAGNARISFAIRQHVTECPNHPMRALERENRALRALDGSGYL